MIDLRTQLQADIYHYQVAHHQNSTLVHPKINYVNREPPVQELVASTFLRADRYSISWRMACGNVNQLQRCDILIFLDNFTTPSLMYDVRHYNEYSVAFHLKKSQYVYVLLRIQGRAPVCIHSLHFMLARDVIVGHDPLMYEWDMVKVAGALKQQRLIRNQLWEMHTLFEWPTILKEMEELWALWKHVFENDCKVIEHYQNTIFKCKLQAPSLLATSRNSVIGFFHCDSHGDWTLNIKGNAVSPTYIHPQYFIWCFPDKQMKFSLRRDTPVLPNKIDFTLQGNDMKQTPIWYWLGYNFIGNSPFYNFWSVIIKTLEFINREDLLSLFEQIDEHFEHKELQPETNLYK